MLSHVARQAVEVEAAPNVFGNLVKLRRMTETHYTRTLMASDSEAAAPTHVTKLDTIF